MTPNIQGNERQAGFCAKFKLVEKRREASAAEQRPLSAGQISPVIELGLKKNTFTKTNKQKVI